LAGAGSSASAIQTIQPRFDKLRWRGTAATTMRENILLICSTIFVASAFGQKQPATYTGSLACKTCHPQIYARWNKTRMADIVRDPYGSCSFWWRELCRKWYKRNAVFFWARRFACIRWRTGNQGFVANASFQAHIRPWLTYFGRMNRQVGQKQVLIAARFATDPSAEA